MKTLSEEDCALILGALDSLGVALTNHDHQWSVGEREIYEQSVALVSTASDDCMETDLSASVKFPLGMLSAELPQGFAPFSSQSRELECSDWRVGGFVLYPRKYRIFRCFWSICSWGCWVLTHIYTKSEWLKAKLWRESGFDRKEEGAA